jgi:hypothetical protein
VRRGEPGPHRQHPARDSGAVDQNGDRTLRAQQCGHLALGTWNHVTVNLATRSAGKQIARVLVGAAFAEVAGRWRTAWAHAFTPGDPEFPGHLPALVTSGPDPARTYYPGVLLALYTHNTRVSATGPVFLTGGPRRRPTTMELLRHLRRRQASVLWPEDVDRRLVS